MNNPQLEHSMRQAVSWLRKAQAPKPLRGAASLAKNALKRVWVDLDNQREFENAGEHERMLADAIRVDTYYAAITKHVKPGDVVVDLGTGTGILAFFAARAGAKRVYAVDHGNTIEVAREVAAANGIDNVEFVNMNSRKFEPPEPVDVIVHEQIGDELFDENMIENISDLRDRILKPGGIILPARFELFLEPIELRAEHAVPAVWQQELHGIRFDVLKDKRLGPWRHTRGDVAASSRWIHPFEVSRILATPRSVFQLDLQTVRGDALAKTMHFSKTITADGRFDGLCMYFSAAFDDELGFDTSPLSPKTHWGCLLLGFPVRPCRAGDTLEFKVDIDDVRDVGSWDIRLVNHATFVGD